MPVLDGSGGANLPEFTAWHRTPMSFIYTCSLPHCKAVLVGCIQAARPIQHLILLVSVNRPRYQLPQQVKKLAPLRPASINWRLTNCSVQSGSGGGATGYVDCNWPHMRMQA
jgi:hypothetical protein